MELTKFLTLMMGKRTKFDTHIKTAKVGRTKSIAVSKPMIRRKETKVQVKDLQSQGTSLVRDRLRNNPPGPKFLPSLETQTHDQALVQMKIH